MQARERLRLAEESDDGGGEVLDEPMIAQRAGAEAAGD
jgi:hypothetical protein